MRKQIRITERQVAALSALADKRRISGQRNAKFQPVILHIADLADAALDEMATALEIVEAIAVNGLDWYEAVDFIRPEHDAP